MSALVPILDETTGEVLGVRKGEGDELETTDVEELRRLAKAYRSLVEGLKKDVEGLERDERNHRRKIAALEAEISEQLQQVDEAQTIRTLFNYWVEKTGRNRKRTKLGDARKKKVLARLREGHSPERIMRAIDGAALGAMTSNNVAEREALLRVMREAVGMVGAERAGELRRIYREALGNVSRFDDLELICRDETKLERFADLADRIDPQAPSVTVEGAV